MGIPGMLAPEDPGGVNTEISAASGDAPSLEHLLRGAEMLALGSHSREVQYQVIPSQSPGDAMSHVPRDAGAGMLHGLKGCLRPWAHWLRGPGVPGQGFQGCQPCRGHRGPPKLPLYIGYEHALVSASRDWYLNGNYLVILVSVTIILPLALMKQLGKWGRGWTWDCRGLCPLLSSPPRLPGLRQWLLTQLHGLLPHLGEHRAGMSLCEGAPRAPH